MPRKTDGTDIKRYNRNKIYHFLYQKKDIAKQDIAYALQLSLPTVTQNLRELEALDLIEATGSLESTGGRKARAISFKSSGRLAIGLELSANHASIAIVDLARNVISAKHVRLPFVNERYYFKELGSLIQRMVGEIELSPTAILGVGISLPAVLSADGSRVLFSRALRFVGVQLKNFSEFIPYPCILCNEAHAAGLAEYSEEVRQDFVYLSLNEGVSAAMISDGQLLRGQQQRAGFIGHTTLIPDGKPCCCGQRGCVDAYCGAYLLTEAAGGRLDNFFANLERGNPRYQVVWSEYLKMLALTIHNLHLLLDCTIVLGGGVGSYLDDYLEMLADLAAQHSPFTREAPALQIGEYRLEAAAVGAALLYLNPFLESF